MFKYPDDYFFVEEGEYGIGLSLDTIDEIVSRNTTGIKREYLYTSFPERIIHLTDFHISKRLVTARIFGEFVNETGYNTDAETEGWGWTWKNGWRKKEGLNWKSPFGTDLDIGYRESADVIPVMQTSWNDAVAFCKWLSAKCGLKIRIPAEAEWEAWARGAQGMETVQVTEKNETVEDFFGMLVKQRVEHPEICPRGMLWEWTENWFDMYEKGLFNRDFGTTYKVLRGGSLMSEAVQKRAEYRFRRCPTARSPFYGFRICVV